MGTETTVTVTVFDDELEIRLGGCMWVGTGGRQFADAADAMEAEVHTLIVESGDDPDEFGDVIDGARRDAIAQQCA